MPYDLQRHITTKYLTKQERNQYVIDKFNSALGLAEFKKNLSSLPPDTRVNLFVNGIYNKFNNLLTHLGSKDMSQLAYPRCGQIIRICSYTYQIIRINLDTIYYGYHLAGSNHNETPSFTMNSGSDRYLQDINIRYCPTEGHSELTQDIRVEDFEMVTRILFKRLKSPNKKFTEERNKILYEFALIVQVLATKYTKLKEQAVNERKLAKQQAVEAKNRAKQQAVVAKKLAKEQAVVAKKLAKEQAVKSKKLAKEEAIVAKKLAKEQAVESRNRAKQQAVESRNRAKQQAVVAKKLAKEQAVKSKKLAKEQAVVAKKLAKEEAIVAKKLAKEEIRQMKQEEKLSKKLL
jgi:hypothetical protein